jgi:hypothetical protein
VPPLTTDTPASRESARQPLGDDLRACQRALLALKEFGLGGELERHRLGRNDMFQRATLLAGEHGGVELLGQRFIVGQDDAAARATQRLVGRGGHHVGVRHR